MDKMICRHGHEVKKETDSELKKEYPYYCPTCDENMYKFEVEKEEMKKVTVEQVERWLGTSNPEAEAIEALVDLANGDYKPEVLLQDITSYEYESEKKE